MDLGSPLWTALGFAIVGVAFGLALQVVARPQGSALPTWLPRLRNEDVTHGLYGLAVGLGAALFVTLFQGPLGIVFALLGELGGALLLAVWALVVTGLAVSGAEGPARKRILLAHAKTLGALVILALVGAAIVRLTVLRDAL